MNSKALLSSLIIGSGSIAAGGYGVYLTTSSSFNPLKMAAKTVETAKLLKETFQKLKKAKEEFLKIVKKSDDNQEEEKVVREPEDEDGEQLIVKKTDEEKIQELFKNIFLSKGLENLLLQELLPEIKEKIEKSIEIEGENYENLKNSWESTDEWKKVIDLAEKFADQVISLYGELPSLFKDQEKLFGAIKLDNDNKNPFKNSSYSPSLMSIPEKIFTLEGDKNSKKEGVGNPQEGEGVNNESQDKIEDNIFGLKISGTPILDSEGFAEALKEGDVFEVITEKVADSQKIKTLTLKLKKPSEEQPDEKPETTIWTYFGFTNADLQEWKDIITGKKFEEFQQIPEAK